MENVEHPDEPKCKECGLYEYECNIESKVNKNKCPGYLMREAERKGEMLSDMERGN